jgi:Flp pilus assembly pilin Flp
MDPIRPLIKDESGYGLIELAVFLVLVAIAVAILL